MLVQYAGYQLFTGLSGNIPVEYGASQCPFSIHE